MRHLWPRLGDQIRHLGRHTIADKMRALAKIYDFQPIESLFDAETVPPTESSWVASAPSTLLDGVDSIPAPLQACSWK